MSETEKKTNAAPSDGADAQQTCIGCGAVAKCMQCPTCLKKGLSASYFCTQDCFKKNWGEHKHAHKAADFEPPKFRYTGELRPAYVTPMRALPNTIERPEYFATGVATREQMGRRKPIAIVKGELLDKMRVACRLGREVLDAGAAAIGVGVTTEEVDRVVHEACIERNCYPSPLNYYNFPKSCCTSVNEVVCHGIPDTRPLEDGDIVNIDISIFHNGVHADLNETFTVGNVDDASKDLIKAAHDSMWAAINICKPGTAYRDLGAVIEKHAKGLGFSVNRTYCGHGIGEDFHSPPTVPHYTKNKAIGEMKVGHVFTIEPMINAGAHEDVTWPDDWTAVTRDGSRSAQFEHTLIITDTGYEILTGRTDKSRPLWWE